VVRRFLKRLYQELDSARDDMIANLEKQKKDQHYNAWMDSLDVHDPDFGDKFMMGPPPYKTKPSSKGQ
jgi:hypothetical protein